MMHLTDWLLAEVALLPIGLTKMISLTKSSFNHPSVMESPLRLPPPLDLAFVHIYKKNKAKATFVLTSINSFFGQKHPKFDRR
jgi:hypothetical protein